MSTIMITGATDGIGLETAKRLASLDHRLVIHGRSPGRLSDAREAIEAQRTGSVVGAVLGDLSDLSDVDATSTTTPAASPIPTSTPSIPRRTQLSSQRSTK